MSVPTLKDIAGHKVMGVYMCSLETRCNMMVKWVKLFVFKKINAVTEVSHIGYLCPVASIF